MRKQRTFYAFERRGWSTKGTFCPRRSHFRRCGSHRWIYKLVFFHSLSFPLVPLSIFFHQRARQNNEICMVCVSRRENGNDDDHRGYKKRVFVVGWLFFFLSLFFFISLITSSEYLKCASTRVVWALWDYYVTCLYTPLDPIAIVFLHWSFLGHFRLYRIGIEMKFRKHEKTWEGNFKKWKVRLSSGIYRFEKKILVWQGIIRKGHEGRFERTADE